MHKPTFSLYREDQVIIPDTVDNIKEFQTVLDIKNKVLQKLNIPVTQQLICLDNIILQDHTEIKLLYPQIDSKNPASPFTAGQKSKNQVIGPGARLELREAKGLANLKINLINDNKHDSQTEHIPVQIQVHSSVSVSFLEEMIKKAYQPLIPSNSKLLIFFRKT